MVSESFSWQHAQEAKVVSGGGLGFQLSVFPYQLHFLRHLSVAERPDRHGALLRFQFQDGACGYSDLHPWSEWGDLPLAQEIEQLKKRAMTRLGAQSYRFARADALARAENRSLWEGLKIPRSHFLVLDWKMPLDFQRLAGLGFKALKLKLGSSALQQTAALRAWFLRAANSGLKVRLDFNQQLTYEQFQDWLPSMVGLEECLDFIEDPFPYDAKQWSEVTRAGRVRLAFDQVPHGGSEADLSALLVQGSCAVFVHKPATQSMRWVREQLLALQVPCVVTSYLDHPLGQLFAGWSAAQMARELGQSQLLTCGLVSHQVYEPHLFSQKLRLEGPDLWVPDETAGIGWGAELEGLAWQ